MMAWWIALQFLSCLPVRLARMPSPAQNGRSLLYYPMVGLLFGMLLWALDWLLADSPKLLHAALLLLAWVTLTGGLHLDGLADTADAWVGGYGDRARTLAIMKDPRSGPMAVVTLVLLLLIKFAAMLALVEGGASTYWWLVPVFGRAALLGLFLSTPYVRPGGLGKALAEHLPRSTAIWILALCMALALCVAPAAALAGVLAFWFLRRLMLRRLGGTTGDTAGALLECLEVVMLVSLALG
ncbi:adenosylcobinamide-GDP ribazoletransferase [Pseudomonas sp. DC3000-4b1]|uniref:adenosylcobinamide-GDP ribazoletransferase n=1 Tax=unclassified Pseudomonas TaxID=196821 RepID=UPI003CF1B749